MPRERRRVFVCIAVLLVALFLEGFSWAAYYLSEGKPFNYGEVRHAQQLARQARMSSLVKQVLKDTGDPESTRFQPHPYLGYVLKPQKKSYASAGSNKYGFLDLGDTEFLGNEDTVNIVFTGGSVAVLCAMFSHDALLEPLKAIPQFKGRKLQLITLAQEAYKQPEQLFSLLYYLTLGGKIDMLVNLDGVNEFIVTDMMRAQGVWPYYPMYWSQLGVRPMTPDYVATLHSLYGLRQWQSALAKTANTLSFSITVDTAWLMANRLLEKNIAIKNAALLKTKNADSAVLGPPSPALNDAQIVSSDVHIWKMANLQMQAIAQTAHAPYFHFLQPSQYVKDSKVFTEHERSIAISPTLPSHLIAGYPQLQAELPSLRKAGIHAVDLTPLYKSVKEEIYYDDCCHVNQKGTDMIMGAIAAEIARFYGAAKETPRAAKQPGAQSQ